MKIGNWKRQGFTLVELLVTIGVIAILASMLLPAVTKAKQKANQISCLNNLRQVGLAATMYAGDFDGQFPPRRRKPKKDTESIKLWDEALKPYYKDAKMMKCSSDSFKETRSYLMNGWNDYFRATLSPADYFKFQKWQWPNGMKETDVPLPSETIIFGEKRVGSKHVHMDFGQGAGNDKEQVAQNMHKYGTGTGGGSNFAFVDGSTRFLRYGGSVKPVNLWAVTDIWRSAPVELKQ